MSDPIASHDPVADRVLLRTHGIRIEIAPHPATGWTMGVISLPATTTHHVVVMLAARPNHAGMDVIPYWAGSIPSTEWDRPPDVIMERLISKWASAFDLIPLGLADGDPTGLVRDARAVTGRLGDVGHIPLMRIVAIATGAEMVDLALHSRPAGSDDHDLIGYAPRLTREGTLTGLVPHRMGFPDPRPSEEIALVMDRAIADWVSTMHGAIHPPGTGILTRWTWSREAVAFLSDERHGTYRRQAARLHPAFVPVIVNDPGTARLVDAGLPHERALAVALDLSVSGRGVPELTRARVRRMRTIPATLLPEDIANLVKLSAVVPLHRMPADASGWEDMARHARAMREFHVTQAPQDLMPADFGSRVLESMASGLDPAMLAVAGSSVVDMAVAMGNDLILPVLGGNPDEAWGDDLGTDIAFTLMLSGVSLPEILALCERWHEASPRSSGAIEVAWPALFPVFTASNGLVATCLTTQAELSAEGDAGADGTGSEGLAHCVGSYAPRCATGRTHVVSLARVSEGGMGRRVSTLSLEIDGANDAPTIRPSQHRGRANADPGMDARLAAGELLDFLASHPLPEATLALIRTDRRQPDRMPVIPIPDLLDRWLPFVPGAIRRHGRDGLRRRIESIAAAMNA